MPAIAVINQPATHKASVRINGRIFVAPHLRKEAQLTDHQFVTLHLAEREGFEPPVPLGTVVFKTTVIDHSTISPWPRRLDPLSGCKSNRSFPPDKNFVVFSVGNLAYNHARKQSTRHQPVCLRGKSEEGAKGIGRAEYNKTEAFHFTLRPPCTNFVARNKKQTYENPSIYRRPLRD